MKKIFFSGVKYKLKAVNQERLFSNLSKKHAMFFIKRSSHTQVEVFVKVNNEKAFDKDLKNLPIEILEKKFVGIFSFIKNLLFRFGAVAGLVCAFVFMIGLDRFVFKTQINGLETLKQEQISNVLSQNKLGGILYKNNIQTSEIESVLSKSFDNISLVSVIVKGNTLIISIKEKISAGDYNKPDELQALLAKQSGLITKINLISGTLKVKVGQIVKIGDTLVEPYIIDSSGQKRKVKADAEVTARVWYNGIEVHTSKRFEVKRTGKVFRDINISFMGINLTKPLQQPPFASYETENTQIYISQNTLLPIIRSLTLFYETQSIQINESFESVKEQVFEKAKQKALQMLEEYEIISKEYHTINQNFGITTVEYVVETQKLIN